jgi:hypothetical protein
MEQILKRLLAEMDFMQERMDADLKRMEALMGANNEYSDISFIFVLH